MTSGSVACCCFVLSVRSPPEQAFLLTTRTVELRSTGQPRGCPYAKSDRRGGHGLHETHALSTSLKLFYDTGRDGPLHFLTHSRRRRALRRLRKPDALSGAEHPAGLEP